MFWKVMKLSRNTLSLRQMSYRQWNLLIALAHSIYVVPNAAAVSGYKIDSQAYFRKWCHHGSLARTSLYSTNIAQNQCAIDHRVCKWWKQSLSWHREIKEIWQTKLVMVGEMTISSNRGSHPSAPDFHCLAASFTSIVYRGLSDGKS